MSKDIRFQGKHTRNSNDWTYTRGKDGRLIMAANKKGVAQRIGIVMEYLGKNPHSNVTMITLHLEKVHSSYNKNDARHALRVMRKYGIVSMRGEREDSDYALTANGVRIWKNAKRTFK